MSAPQLAAHARGDGLAVRGHPLRSRAGGCAIRTGRLAVAPLVLRSGTGQATLTGKLPLAPADEWDLTGEPRRARPRAGAGGRRPRRRRPGDRHAARRRARATSRTAASRSARTAISHARTAPRRESRTRSCSRSRAGASGRASRLERLEAQLAGGRVSGTARYDAAPGAIAASLEAAGLAWERLPLVPAPARPLAGTLAGRLALDGRTSAPVGELDARPRRAAPRRRAARRRSRSARARTGASCGFTGTSGEARAAAGHRPARGRLAAAARGRREGAAVRRARRRDSRDEAGRRARSRAAARLDARAAAAATRRQLRYASSDLAFSGRLRKLDWRIAPFSLEGDRDSLQVSGLKLEAGKRLAHGARRARGSAAASPFDLELEAQLDFESLGPALPVARARRRAAR